VRPDGGCEVKPEMRCVWLEAGEGQKRIGTEGSTLAAELPPLPR